MKVRSTITTGHRTDGGSGPLVHVGEDDFGGRKLSTQERALIDALADAKLLEILEEDAPEVTTAKVIPIDRARATAVPPESAPRKRATKRRVRRA